MKIAVVALLVLAAFFAFMWWRASSTRREQDGLIAALRGSNKTLAGKVVAADGYAYNFRQDNEKLKRDIDGKKKTIDALTVDLETCQNEKAKLALGKPETAAGQPPAPLREQHKRKSPETPSKEA